jgi:small subunit ribosomal protein S6
MHTSLQAYEATFILGESALLEHATAKAAELTAYVTEHGGTVTRQELWGRRELAYAIKRNRTGFYVTMWFELPKQEVQPLEQHMLFDESIIRSMVTKAYTSAQEGSLYPVVVEEDKSARPRGEKSSAEEMLRRSTKPSKKAEGDDEAAEELPEEERMKQLDELLKEEVAAE